MDYAKKIKDTSQPCMYNITIVIIILKTYKIAKQLTESQNYKLMQ